MLRNKILASVIVGTIIVGTGIPVMAKGVNGVEQNSTPEPTPVEYKSDDFYSTISDTTSNYFVDDCAVINNYETKTKHEKKKEEVIVKRENKVTKCSWLRAYGINPGNLSDSRLDFLEEAHNWLGSWYLYGGEIPPRQSGGVWESPSTGRGFDCSSYVEYVTKKTKGFDIGRTTHDQPDSSHLHRVNLSQAKPGDLVYSHSGEHVGIFIRNNGDGTILMMHDPKTGDKVKIGNYHTNINVYEVY